MSDYVTLPDGSTYPRLEGESYGAAMRAAYAKYPEAFGRQATPEKGPESGFTPALKAGFANLKGDVAALAGRAGLMDTEAAEAYKAQQEAEAQKIFKPTEKGWTEDPLTKVKELAGGSLPYMVAPAAAGAAAFLLPEAAAAAPVLGGLLTAGEAAGAAGAGLASAAQFTGSNLSRQMQAEGKKLSETDLGAAALAAVPQAALDVVSLKMIPGVRNILGAGGVKISEEAAQKAAQEGIKNIAADYAKATGKTMSIEGLTEAGQQVFERLQAGLSLTDNEARQEYWDNFLGGAVLGGVLAPGGHYIERGQAQAEAQRRKEEADQATALQAKEAEEAAKSTPEALKQLDTDYRTADQQLKALNEKVNAAKPVKGATEDEKAAYEEAKKERTAFITDTYKPLRQEYTQRKDAIAQMYEQQQAAIEAGTAEQPAAKQALPSEVGDFTVTKEGEAQAQPYQMANVLNLNDSYQQLKAQLDKLQEQYTQGADIPTQQKLETQMEEVEAHMKDLAPAIERMGGSTMTMDELNKALATSEKKRLEAMQLGKIDVAKKQALEIQDLTKRIETVRKGDTARGETQNMFAEAPAPKETPVDETMKQQVLQSERERAPYGVQDLRTRRQAAMETFGMADISPKGYAEAAKTTPETVAQNVIQPKQLADVETAKTAVATANKRLDEVLKTTGTSDTDTLYQALDNVSKASNAASRAQEDIGRPSLKPAILDIFDPANSFYQALASGDTKTLNNLAAHADTTAMRQALDKAGDERTRLVNILESRLGLGGEGVTTKGQPLKSVKRERADLFSTTYNPKQQAQFKNGTSLAVIKQQKVDKNGDPVFDKSGKPELDIIKLQDVYDQGGPAAVDYETTLASVQKLARSITTRQGNAKYSLYDQLSNVAQEHQAALDSVKTGKVEYADGTSRQLTPVQLAAAKKRIPVLKAKFEALEKKITPVRDDILKLWGSLYKTSPLETVAKEKEQKEALAAAPAKEAAARVAALPELTKKIDEAKNRLKTAVAFKDDAEIQSAKEEIARLNKIKRSSTTLSSVAKKAKKTEAANEAVAARQNPLERQEALDRVAAGLGKDSEKFLETLDAAGDKIEELKSKYGADSEEVRDFRESTRLALQKMAVQEGRKTPEYRDAVKNMEGEAKPMYPKRTPEMRKQSAAPSEIRGVGAEAKQAGEGKVLEGKALSTAKGKITRAANKAKKNESNTAYRLGEAKLETTVDAAEAQKVIDGLKLPENVKFVYAPTPGKIPVRLLNMMAKEGVDPTEGMVQGAVFPDGTVLVVGDQHANVKDLEETIAHEIIGHYGIDTVIGLGRLNAFAKKTDVAELAKRLGGKPLLDEVMNTVRANADLGRSEEVQKLQALREIIAHTAEARVTESFREKAGRWLKELVGMVRAGLRDMGLKNLSELSTSDVFYMLKQSRKAFANKTIGPYKAADGEVAFRRRTEPSEYGVGRPAGVIDTLLGNMMGLAGRVQFIDQYAALEAAVKKGLSKGIISSLEAVNANYLLRFGQQRSQFAGQFMTHGPVKAIHTKKDGGIETVYKSTKGVSMMDVAKRVGEAGIGNDTEHEDMFTLYMAGKRAKQVGWDKLNYENPADAKAKYDKMMTKLGTSEKAKQAFEDAAKMYQEYNAGLLDFLVDTGALSREKANELKAISYVPFYRINGDGEVQLLIDKEKAPIRIANTKDQPMLKQLVGGNTEIMPIFTSAAQNTFMITGMGLRNQAVKETSFMLQKLGIASRVASGFGPKGDNVVRFFKKGQPYYAVIDTDAYGIPADLILKGMEGIKTPVLGVMRAMGVPAQLLRNFVVRMPTYALRQVIRDPLNAWLTTGTDATPVLSSMKELAHMVAGRSEAETKLMEAGAISSNVYSGDEADMGKFLEDIAAGKSMWEKAIGRLDAFALQGDAATRAVIYKDSLAKGMTEQEALLRTLESMNFSRRGVSPSMHALSVMIPFFNAQVQGLDVIYRAFKGDMPFSEQLKIREKMVQRGMLLAAGTIAYAAMMQDDEAYKRAKPEERYANWFVYVPGISEPVRVPIPFEMGFLFKALPEAVWNAAIQDDKAGYAAKGIGKLFMQTVPNPVPQALKPGIEAVLGKSFYGGDIESAREKEMMATDRYREGTTELSKMIGAVTGKAGVSPIMLDHLIRGYTGGLGIALVQLANPILSTDSREIAAPSTKPSKIPLIGGLFQPVEGRGTLDEAYDRMTEIRQVKGTYNRLIEDGRRAEAKEFTQNYANDLAAASTSGAVQKRLGMIAAMERQVRAHPTMTTEQKDAKLEQLDKMKMDVARRFLALTDRTTPQ